MLIVMEGKTDDDGDGDGDGGERQSGYHKPDNPRI